MTTAAAEDIAFWLGKATREGWTGQHDLPFGRDDLAAYFAGAGFFKGAEIGVEQGEYAEVLCRANPTIELFCVDSWRAYRGYREHVTQAKIDGFYYAAAQRLIPYENVHIVKAFSAEAARVRRDESLDFVFIDANHQLEYVIADLASWVPKVRPGGIVAGHDYKTSKGKAGAVFHVPYAVQAWTKAYGIDPWFVLRGDSSPSWCWVKK